MRSGTSARSKSPRPTASSTSAGDRSRTVAAMPTDARSPERRRPASMRACEPVATWSVTVIRSTPRSSMPSRPVRKPAAASSPRATSRSTRGASSGSVAAQSGGTRYDRGTRARPAKIVSTRARRSSASSTAWRTRRSVNTVFFVPKRSISIAFAALYSAWSRGPSANRSSVRVRSASTAGAPATSTSPRRSASTTAPRSL